jgi:hypothetical protein
MIRQMLTLMTAAIVGVLALLAGCATPGTPSSSTQQTRVGGGPLVGGSVLAQSASGLPAWIVEPPTLPSGRVGQNNCTFAFGLVVPQWDFHPDAGCWEHAGPDGWTRQQFQKIHVPSHPACGGGPGDATAIRVCQAPGLANPCSPDQTTGSNGCAQCVVNTECH